MTFDEGSQSAASLNKIQQKDEVINLGRAPVQKKVTLGLTLADYSFVRSSVERVHTESCAMTG